MTRESIEKLDQEIERLTKERDELIAQEKERLEVEKEMRWEEVQTAYQTYIHLFNKFCDDYETNIVTPKSTIQEMLRTMGW